MNESAKQEDILESTTDAAEWSLEVERVLPQLKVTIRTDNKVQKTERVWFIWIFIRQFQGLRHSHHTDDLRG